MSTHDALYEAASNAITTLAADPDVSAEQSAASLKSLRVELDTLIDGQAREAEAVGQG